MATKYWKGGAPAVQQVSDATVDTYDAASTYTVSIGDYDISVAGDTDVATTAANLVTALNASAHPYFAAVTWSVPSGSTVRGIADTAGVPFVAALTVSGGTGTVTTFSDTTACTGPHHVDEVENWNSGTLPIASDDVIIASGPSLLYGLDQFTGTAFARVEVRHSFEASIGLEKQSFATDLPADTLDTSVPEYRDTYLELQADEIVVGEHIGAGAPAGAVRVCIDQKKAGASVLDIVQTGTTSQNSRPIVRYLAANASADIIVQSAPGGVGVAVEPGETSTIGDVHVADTTSTSQVYIGSGTTWTTGEFEGGTTRAAAAATVTTVDARGGTVELTGYDYLVTTLNVHGGTVTDTHENTGGAEWTTINVYGGKLELPKATVSASRAYTTMNLYGGRVEADWGALSGTEVVASDAALPERRAVDITTL